MAITQWHVDPAIADGVGVGSSGDPYGSVQEVLTEETWDAANGTQINVKTGTNDVLAATLDFSSFGASFTEDAPLVIRGYANTANDGGQGIVDGDATYTAIFQAEMDWCHLFDMRFTNCGSSSNALVNMDNNCVVWNCEFDTSNKYGLQVQDYCYVGACYIHDCAWEGIRILSGQAEYNYVNQATYNGIYHRSSAICTIQNNIVVVGTNSNVNGFKIRDNTVVQNNVVYCPGAGEGNGILVDGTSFHINACRNNIIEGFSNSGNGVDWSPAGTSFAIEGSNAFYNCATERNGSPLVWHRTGDISLDVSPFVDAANGDFRLNSEPTGGALCRTTNVPTTFKGLGLAAGRDMGAVQRAGGGAGAIHMTGGMRS